MFVVCTNAVDSLSRYVSDMILYRLGR